MRKLQGERQVPAGASDVGPRGRDPAVVFGAYPVVTLDLQGTLLSLLDSPHQQQRPGMDRAELRPGAQKGFGQCLYPA